MRRVRQLPLEAVLAILERERIGPVPDFGLLQSALERPATVVMGRDAYPGIELKAAALLHSVCLNHALVDGNKRLSAIAALVFLELNGLAADLTNDELFQLVMDVASGAERDVSQIAARLNVGPKRKT